ncbi:MAG: four helix bundle protein [Arachidicoccus sp.]|nr:four helix bundle protein [Arachidicoccus sp.]
MYRTLPRAKSTDDFINKVAIIIEEADESLYCLEIIHEVKLIDKNSMIKNLIKEANELTAIFVAISKTTKAKKANHNS